MYLVKIDPKFFLILLKMFLFALEHRCVSLFNDIFRFLEEFRLCIWLLADIWFFPFSKFLFIEICPYFIGIKDCSVCESQWNHRDERRGFPERFFQVNPGKLRLRDTIFPGPPVNTSLLFFTRRIVLDYETDDEKKAFLG